MKLAIALLICAALAAGSIVGLEAQAPAALANRVQALEDRDAIRALLVSYASTLDNRDWTGFEQLWAKNAEFLGGGGNNATGPAAIRDLLRGLLTKNAAPSPGRDFHLVMNQTVERHRRHGDRSQPRHVGVDQRGESTAGDDHRQLLRPVREGRRPLEVQTAPDRRCAAGPGQCPLGTTLVHRPTRRTNRRLSLAIGHLARAVVC
jgi:hypothetical protein